MVAPSIPIDWIPWLMILHFISGVGYLATRDFITNGEKWADIPMIAIVFHFGMAALIVFPIIGEFAKDFNGVSVIYGELALFYFIEGLIAFGYAVVTAGYYLYLKLGWFEGMYSGKVARVRPMERRGY